jgi:hypothetical protein
VGRIHLQTTLFLAAGQAMLAEGQGRAGLPLIEFACLVISAVKLRATVFSKATAYAGILGNMLLLVVEIILAFERRLPGVGMVIAAGGGLFAHDLVPLGWQKAAAALASLKWVRGSWPE